MKPDNILEAFNHKRTLTGVRGLVVVKIIICVKAHAARVRQQGAMLGLDLLLVLEKLAQNH
jgi:hypothetical protein